MPADHLKPRDAPEVEQAIQWAIAGGKALEVVGHGTKRAIGRAVVEGMLGREWTGVLFGDVATQKQEARRAPRDPCPESSWINNAAFTRGSSLRKSSRR